MGKKILYIVASICKSIEEVNMIILIDMLTIPFRQDRRSENVMGGRSKK